MTIDQWFFCENNWSEDFYTEVSLITGLYLWLHPMLSQLEPGNILSMHCHFAVRSLIISLPLPRLFIIQNRYKTCLQFILIFFSLNFQLHAFPLVTVHHSSHQQVVIANIYKGVHHLLCFASQFQKGLRLSWCNISFQKTHKPSQYAISHFTLSLNQDHFDRRLLCIYKNFSNNLKILCHFHWHTKSVHSLKL